MLDQTPDIIGIGREPVLVVLRPVEGTSGKTATIIGHDLIVRGQVGCKRAEGLSSAAGSWNENQERAVTAHLVKEFCAGNRENTHLFSFFPG